MAHATSDVIANLTNSFQRFNEDASHGLTHVEGKWIEQDYGRTKGGLHPDRARQGSTRRTTGLDFQQVPFRLKRIGMPVGNLFVDIAGVNASQIEMIGLSMC